MSIKKIKEFIIFLKSTHAVQRLLGKAYSYVVRWFYLLGFMRQRDSKREEAFIPSSTPIDIVIPVVEKDLETLPYCLAGVKKNIKHPIGHINLISPPSEKIKEFCKENGYRFFDENEALPITKKDIPYVCNGKDRSGWLLQTMLKWAEHVSSNEYYLVVDSDTVYIRPQVFLHGDKPVLIASERYFPPYYLIIEKLLGIKKERFLSFTAHQMFYSKSKLKELQEDMYKHTGLKWHEAIYKLSDKSQGSCYSGYEAYGTWLHNKYKDEIVVQYWYNSSQRRKDLSRIDELAEEYSNKFRSLSFHEYLN